MYEFKLNTEQNQFSLLFNGVAVRGSFWYIYSTATLYFQLMGWIYTTLENDSFRAKFLPIFLTVAWLSVWKQASALLHYLVYNSLSLSALQESSRWSQSRMEGLACLLSDCQAHKSSLLQHGALTFFPSGSCFLPFPVDALFPRRSARYTCVLFCFRRMFWRDSSTAR